MAVPANIYPQGFKNKIIDLIINATQKYNEGIFATWRNHDLPDGIDLIFRSLGVMSFFVPGFS